MKEYAKVLTSRRTFLGLAGLTASSVLNVGNTEQTFASRDAAGWVWSDTASANGWPIDGEVTRFLIEGSDAEVSLTSSVASQILLHVVRRWNYEVGGLETKDLSGWDQERRVQYDWQSNYLSGTAVSIRPRFYPVGVAGGLYPKEIVVVRDILADMNGVVAWGGDFLVPKESHFEICLPPSHSKVHEVLERVTSWDLHPSQGAGSIDAFDPTRVARSRRFRNSNSR